MYPRMSENDPVTLSGGLIVNVPQHAHSTHTHNMLSRSYNNDAKIRLMYARALRPFTKQSHGLNDDDDDNNNNNESRNCRKQPYLTLRN